MPSECFICYENKNKFEKLNCSHSLCYDCYFKLKKSICPFCRKEFIKKIEKKKLQNNIIFIPRNILNLDNFNLIRTYHPFSKAIRKMKRPRRRDLTLAEVLYRRKLIKTRNRRKWLNKN